MTDLEDFITNLFQLQSSSLKLKAKTNFFELFELSPIGKFLRAKIFSLDDFASAWSSTLGKVFSLTEFSNTWATTLNKIFSLSDFNTTWSSTFNKVFSLTDFSSAWASQLNKIFDTTALGTWLDNNLKSKINESILPTLNTKSTVNTILNASINKVMSHYSNFKIELDDDLDWDFVRVVPFWEQGTFRIEN